MTQVIGALFPSLRVFRNRKGEMPVQGLEGRTDTRGCGVVLGRALRTELARDRSTNKSTGNREGHGLRTKGWHLSCSDDSTGTEVSADVATNDCSPVACCEMPFAASNISA